ncbi:class I SAM-dependent methyltransferase [Sporosarcina sp. E16_8]|uniref:class I SAM-dependent DNA methyltransferase n=1 Tax=Sporosarcina sp. E16_8 TaxID=2789295 RepID=UPI001A92245C|nr:class I SAM-dependent methyltransferase [Sporosarcina sp. E16_8]MBO0586918.1 class I SAM-dependent methyltransferase [Sporosarcina sp. E16_8]
MSRNAFEENFEKYADPEMYDHFYEGYQKDLNVILEWAKLGQPIIELACGTGRLTIPMAKRGFQMVGVDLHEGMLERAKQKAKVQMVSIEFLLQDCTKLNLPVKSSLVFMTGNSFQHFLTNEVQDALLQTVRQHLVKDGVFIFDTRNPLLHELATVDEYEQQYSDKNGNQIIELHREEYNSMTQILHYRTDRQIYRGETLIANEQDGISLRYSFPLEMERVLKNNGFEILQVYGDWDKSGLNVKSISMVYVCKIK